jgi:hypothetical protein
MRRSAPHHDRWIANLRAVCHPNEAARKRKVCARAAALQPSFLLRLPE